MYIHHRLYTNVPCKGAHRRTCGNVTRTWSTRDSWSRYGIRPGPRESERAHSRLDVLHVVRNNPRPISAAIDAHHGYFAPLFRRRYGHGEREYAVHRAGHCNSSGDRKRLPQRRSFLPVFCVAGPTKRQWKCYQFAVSSELYTGMYFVNS